MPRTIKHKKLESVTARARLKRQREAHKETLKPGKASLGYQRQDAAAGRWLLRRYLGGKRYTIVLLGLADDLSKADGTRVLPYEDAKKAALEKLDQGQEGVSKGSLTVRKAFADYIDSLKGEGQRTLETERRGAALIMPELGDLLVAELTSRRLRKWRDAMVARPALLRSKRDGKKQNTKPNPADAEAIRKRRVSANRVLAMLKAALNFAHDNEDKGQLTNSDAWGRKLKKFKDVEVSRNRYLSVAEAKRLLNACDPSFRFVVQAALETGARYSELCRLQILDFNPDTGKVHVRKSKSGKDRHVTLSEEGVSFFAQITTGRHGGEFMLRNTGRVERELEKERARLIREGKNPNKATVDDDGEWRSSEQNRPMREACERAKIEPLGIHAMRHTWASLSLMAGMPMLAVAENLGHANTRMTERHYKHLTETYVTEAIRAGAPRFGFVADKKVVSMAAE